MSDAEVNPLDGLEKDEAPHAGFPCEESEWTREGSREEGWVMLGGSQSAAVASWEVRVQQLFSPRIRLKAGLKLCQHCNAVCPVSCRSRSKRGLKG